MKRRSSSVSCSILRTSCEVRKPSKKWRNGTRASSVAAWETRARSCASCTEPEASWAKPIWRQAITSEWSPKIESACAATVGAALQCAVDGPGRAGLRLHLDHVGHGPPDVRVAVRRPLVAELAHVGGRCDRVDRDDLAHPMG